MSTILDRHDGEIRAAEQDVQVRNDIVKSARGLRLQLEEERRRSRGELAKGDVASLADLDRSADSLISARRAEQDAELAAQVAREKIPPLRRAREDAERAELAAHLGPLLTLQNELAAQVDAAIGVLASTIGLYRAAATESAALAALLGAGNDSAELAGRRVARRLMASLYSTLTTELRYTVTDGRRALAEADGERAAVARAAVEKILPPGAPAA